MTRAQALKKEPSLTGYGDDVIFSPNTSVANPKQVINCIGSELSSKFGQYCHLVFGGEYKEIIQEIQDERIMVKTKTDVYEGKYLIN